MLCRMEFRREGLVVGKVSAFDDVDAVDGLPSEKAKTIAVTTMRVRNADFVRILDGTSASLELWSHRRDN